MINNGSPRSFTKCFVSNVECFAFMTRTCLRTIWHIFCVCSNNESPRSFMCLFNVGILTVFRWTCLDYIRFNNGSPRSLWRNSFFVKRINSWERDVFLPSWTVLASSLTTGLPVLSRLGLRIGWFDGNLLDSCQTSDRWACSEPNSLFHSCFKEIFGGSLGDIVYFFVYDFSNFHPNNFRNTISWKCFLKDDCIRSSLIEFQSFLNCKIDVDPICCVLMSFPCFMHVLCTTRYTQVDHIRILCDFCP